MFFTAATPYGGGEVFTLDEIVSLHRRGIDILLVPRSRGRSVVHEQAEEVLAETLNYPLIDARNVIALVSHAVWKPRRLVSILRWCWRWSWNTKEFLKALAVVPKALRVARKLRGCPVAHVHSTNTNTMAVLAHVVSQELDVPWSFTLHSWWPRIRVRKRNFETMLESASYCRVISHTVCLHLQALIAPRFHAKCVTVHIGVECNPPPCIRGPRNGLFIVATPAGLEEHKGHSVAVEAARILVSREIRGFRWFFYGEGALRDDLARQIRKHGLEAFFEMPGVISNGSLLASYAKGDIHAVILPSIDTTGQPEGIPHALIQAMRYGIPVISTDSGGTLELTGEGAGIVIPQNDPVALAEAMHRLMKDKIFYLSQGENGWNRILSAFNADDTCTTLKKVFNYS